MIPRARRWHVSRLLLVALGIGILIVLSQLPWASTEGERRLVVDGPRSSPPSDLQSIGAPTVSAPPDEQIVAVGPRENVPADAPDAYGFWSFAVPVSGVLSRSGQPLVSEFAWLRERGWTSVVNLRVDGERGEISDDAKLPGFSPLGLTYLHLPIVDGHPPTGAQAETFLSFVTDPAHQPAHVHCRGGIGRTGTVIALYRYAVQGWPMDMAIAESRAFRGGVSALQATWLRAWAEAHPPGSHAPTALPAGATEGS